MGIAVIMDVVHSHTVKNFYEGINEFDGSPSGGYLHTGAEGYHEVWDSRLFDYGNRATKQFLLSNIKYWMEEFHFDGFRFDGVTSMLYRHHGLINEWSRDEYFGNNVDNEAILYLQLANTLVHSLNPHAISISEDVSGMPGMTIKCEDGGLGFDFRLGMGIPDYWIRILEKPHEQWSIGEMWNTLMNRTPQTKTIAYCESHDQALVGDKTIAFRLMDATMYWHMNVEDNNLIVAGGMALHKMIRLITIALGGEAYLNFMGNEFGHPEWIDFPRKENSWSYFYARRQWSLVKNKKLKYHFLADFDREMIRLAKKYHLPNADMPIQMNVDERNKVLVFERSDLVFVFNWHHAHSIPNYRFRVSKEGDYKIILNSDSKKFGGFDRVDNELLYKTVNVGTHFELSIYNVNRAALVFKRVK
jgi:1,4-alpha-glucan branching enzyme